MKVGLPKGLLYYKYHPFFETFFTELGCELIVSEDTCKKVVDAGIKSSTSETCLPIKIFHGHVETLKNKCDFMVIPRIMKVESSEYLCPHLCSLPELITHSIENLPGVTMEPIYFNSQKKLFRWSKDVGYLIGKKYSAIENAFCKALDQQNNDEQSFYQAHFPYHVLLLGHSYTIHDTYLNMNLINKLNALGLGALSSDIVTEQALKNQMSHFTKKPFWYDYKQAYGSALYLSQHHKLDGIIYLSSFGCGMDAIIAEVIKEDIPHIPFMLIKLDEHTGDAGLDTRLEAFSDMLARRSS